MRWEDGSTWDRYLMVAAYGTTAAIAVIVDNPWWSFALGLASFIILAVVLQQGYSRFSRWRALRDPLEVTYLIPRNKYPKAQFIGALNEEQYPQELVVGVGDYRIMHRIVAKTEINIDPVVLRFHGPEVNRPFSNGTDNPFYVEEISGPAGAEYRDWHSDIHVSEERWSWHILKGNVKVIGNRITTTGRWSGYVRLNFHVHGGSVITKSLSFVSVQPLVK